MKKILILLVFVIVAVASSAQTASLSMKTTMTLTTGTNYTLTNTTADTILITAPKNYWTTQSYTINLDSASGNHTNVATALYGRITTLDGWTQIGSTVNWAGISADTTFTINNTTPNNYKYFMVKLTGTGTGTTTIDNQIFNQWYVSTSTIYHASGSQSAGTANAITLDFSPNIPGLHQGLRVSFIADSANTGATTLSIDGGTAKNIYEEVGAAPNALDANDIRAGAVIDLLYDGTQWIMLNPSGN